MSDSASDDQKINDQGPDDQPDGRELDAQEPDDRKPAEPENPQPDVSDGGGYMNPPKKYRFKKGQSGNPEGRRKGAKNKRARVEAMLDLPTLINTNGRKKKVTTFDAVLLRLREKALGGSEKTGLKIVELGLNLDDRNKPEEAMPETLSSEDEAILRSFLDRNKDDDDEAA